ncbi:MAG: hypothetical protein ACON3Z_14430 [Bradymonadia bacterium]
MNCPSRIVRTILLLTLGACVTFSATAFAAEKLLLVQPAASNPAPWHEDLHIALDDALSRELKIASRVDIRYSLNEALLTFSCERATPACMRQVAGMFGVAYIFWTEIQGTGPYEINVQGVHGKRTDENYSLQHTFNSKTAALRAVRPFVAALIAGIPYEGRNAPRVEELARPQADEDEVQPAVEADANQAAMGKVRQNWPRVVAITGASIGAGIMGVGLYHGIDNLRIRSEMVAAKDAAKHARLKVDFYRAQDRANRHFIIGGAVVGTVGLIYGTYWLMTRPDAGRSQVSVTHEGFIFTSRF